MAMESGCWSSLAQLCFFFILLLYQFGCTVTSQPSAPTTNPPCLLPCLFAHDKLYPSGTVSHNKPLSSLHWFFSGHLIIATREWDTHYQVIDRMSYNSPERPVLDEEGLLVHWPGEVFDDQMSQAGLCCGFDSELVSAGSPSCCFLGIFWPDCRQILFPSHMCGIRLWWLHVNLDCLLTSFIWGVDFS